MTVLSQAQINVGTNFQVTGQLPLDNRYVFNDTIERNSISMNYRYEGLSVYIKNLQKNFQLRGGIENINWQETVSTAIVVSDTTGLDPLCEGLTIYSLADSTMWQHRPIIDTVSSSPTYGDTIGCE